MQKIENKIQEFKKKRNVIYFLFLGILIGISIILNYAILAQSAYDSTRILNKFASIGNHREVAYILKDAQLSNFRSIRYVSKDNNRAFILPSKLEIIDEPSFLKSLHLQEVMTPIETGIGTENTESIIYEFNRLRLVPYAVLIWLLIIAASIPQVRYLQMQMIEKFKADLDSEKTLAKAQIAQLVRHNLRTPLSALMKLSDEPKFKAVNVNSEILKSTIYQINEIINKLDDKKNLSVGTAESFDIYQSLHHAKNQIDLTVGKNINFTFKIDDKLFSALVSHVPFELKSILANIINNSIESISGSGFVTVRAIDKDHKLVVTVIDNGCGIEEEIMGKVFEENFTHNKPNGSGLGLYHAKTFIDKWGGRITISSEIGIGTSVQIELPVADRKSWYVPRIKLNAKSKVFILDDQGLTHDLWRLRFKELGIENEVFNAKNFTDIRALLSAHKPDLDSAVFLFDFDIQDRISGLHILKSLPESATRCLVTGHYDDVDMQKDCERNAIKLLPKSEISILPFVVS